MSSFSPRQQVALALVPAIESVCQEIPDHIFDVDIDATGVILGRFSLDQEVFSFNVKPNGEFSYVESDTHNDSYFAGLTANSPRKKSFVCDAKGKRCGEGWIPAGHQCTIGIVGRHQERLKQASKTIQEAKKSGNWKKAVLIGGLAIAGVAALGLGATALANQNAASSPSTPTAVLPSATLPTLPSFPPPIPIAVPPSSTLPTPLLSPPPVPTAPITPAMMFKPAPSSTETIAERQIKEALVQSTQASQATTVETPQSSTSAALPPSPYPSSPTPKKSRLPHPPVTQAVLVSNPTTGRAGRTRVSRQKLAEPETSQSQRAIAGRNSNALSPGPERARNQTQPIENPTLITTPTQGVMRPNKLPQNPTLITSPSQSVMVPGAGSDLPARTRRTRKAPAGEVVETKETKAKSQEEEASKPQASKTKVKTTKAKTTKPKTTKPKPPVKSEVEKATDRLTRKHSSYETKAKAINESKASSQAIAQLHDKVSDLEMAHRQMLNPLHPNYFDSSAQKVREATTQLRQVVRATESLGKKLLKDKSVEDHIQQTNRDMNEVEGHLERLRAAHAFAGSQTPGPARDRMLENLGQQISKTEAIRENIAQVGATGVGLDSNRGLLSSLQERLAVLPTRQSQLDPETLTQHQATQKIRKLQGEMPAKIERYAQEHKQQMLAVAKSSDNLEQLSKSHTTERNFATVSIESLIQRKRESIDRDMQMLKMISGPEGIKWVTSKDDGSIPKEFGLVLNRAKAETGVRSIKTVEEAAKFRDHVQGMLAGRIEATAKDIEARAQYPSEVSQRWLDSANTQLADANELHKQAVVGGRQKSQKLIKDLDTTGRETAIHLMGGASMQPYREMHESMVTDIRLAHAQKARAIGEMVVDAQNTRDSIARDAKNPPVFEINGVAKTPEDLSQDLEAIRAESRKLRTLTQVEVPVTPTAETKIQMAARKQKMLTGQTAREQISQLQKRMGQINLEIKRRQEAKKQGQKKGTQTGKLEAERDGLLRQVGELSKQHFGLEKRDSSRRKRSELPGRNGNPKRRSLCAK